MRWHAVHPHRSTPSCVIAQPVKVACTAVLFHATAVLFAICNTLYFASSCLLYFTHHGIGAVCPVIDATTPDVLPQCSLDVAALRLFEYCTRHARCVMFLGDRSEVHWPF